MELTPIQLDVLTELINIGVGRAAGIINQMSRAHVELQVPELRFLSDEALKDHCRPIADAVLASVRLPFEGLLSGLTVLLFPPESAASLVSIILGQENVPFDEDSLRIGTLEEVGNIVLNGVMGSISNFLGSELQYCQPDYAEDTFANLVRAARVEGDKIFMLARAHFIVAQHLIDGEIIIIFRLGSFQGLLAAIDKVLPSDCLEKFGS
jgi:chemotaxis protein CheC